VLVTDPLGEPREARRGDPAPVREQRGV